MKVVLFFSQRLGPFAVHLQEAALCLSFIKVVPRIMFGSCPADPPTDEVSDPDDPLVSSSSSSFPRRTPAKISSSRPRPGPRGPPRHGGEQHNRRRPLLLLSTLLLSKPTLAFYDQLRKTLPDQIQKRHSGDMIGGAAASRVLDPSLMLDFRSALRDYAEVVQPPSSSTSGGRVGPLSAAAPTTSTSTGSPGGFAPLSAGTAVSQGSKGTRARRNGSTGGEGSGSAGSPASSSRDRFPSLEDDEESDEEDGEEGMLVSRSSSARAKNLDTWTTLVTEEARKVVHEPTRRIRHSDFWNTFQSEPSLVKPETARQSSTRRGRSACFQSEPGQAREDGETEQHEER